MKSNKKAPPIPTQLGACPIEKMGGGLGPEMPQPSLTQPGPLYSCRPSPAMGTPIKFYVMTMVSCISIGSMSVCEKNDT